MKIRIIKCKSKKTLGILFKWKSKRKMKKKINLRQKMLNISNLKLSKSIVIKEYISLKTEKYSNM